MSADPEIELVRVAADYLFVPEIGVAEPARNHAAHMSGGFQKRGAQPFAAPR